MNEIKKLTNFCLNEYSNDLFKKEAGSSFALSKDVAKKVNEIIDAFNNLNHYELQKIQEQDGKINKAVLFMKDNLINSIRELLETLKGSGKVEELIINTLASALKRLEENVSISEFGALGNGFNDDTYAFKQALATGKNIVLPKGTFIISETLTIPAKTIISGAGRDTIIKMKNALNNNINSVILMSGDHGVIENVMIDGSGVANGISFSKNTYHFKIENVLITDCLKGLYDYQSLWMGEFNNVHCKNCVEAFSLANNISKTSLTFKNCWCENCGQAYDFNRVDYSTLLNCGADFCNNISTSPYGKGYGNEDDKRGIYNFVLCKGLTMNSCGSENSYGNGIIKLSATSLIVNGLVATNIKSRFKPSYSTYPNYKVGDILLTAEKNKLILNGYCFNSRFENLAVKELKPNDNQPIIAYNYSENTYGIQNHKSVIVSGLQDLGNVVFDGMGNYKKDCVNLDSNLINMNVESISINGYKHFGAKKINGNGSNCLVIPLIPNSDYNYSHKLKISGIDGSKSNTPHPFYVEVAFASSSSVKQISILNSSEGISCVSEGNNLLITLPYSYESAHIECEAISDKLELIDWNNIVFNI